MNVKLSVIIPIYKVEDYLVRCVESVLSQEYDSIEVILVDDGSPDNCPQMCDELAQRDKRVKVIHKENGGLSSARNAGTEVAKGKYIAYLDSDDQWVKGRLSLLMSQVEASGAKMTLFPSMSLFPDGKLVRRRNDDFFDGGFRVMSRDDNYAQQIDRGVLLISPCTIILEREFVIKNNLYFYPEIVAEDNEWMFRIMRVVDKIAITDECLFIYTRNREGSITNTVSTKSINDLIKIIKMSLEYYAQNPNATTKLYELSHCAYLWSVAVGIYNRIPRQDKKEIKRELVALLEKLPVDKHPKSKKVAMLYKIFGFSLTSYILSLYMGSVRRFWVTREVDR